MMSSTGQLYSTAVLGNPVQGRDTTSTRKPSSGYVYSTATLGSSFEGSDTVLLHCDAQFKVERGTLLFI